MKTRRQIRIGGVGLGRGEGLYGTATYDHRVRLAAGELAVEEGRVGLVGQVVEPELGSGGGGGHRAKILDRGGRNRPWARGTDEAGPGLRG